MRKFRFRDLTQTDQKALFFIVVVLILGALLNLFGYSPPSLKDREQAIAKQDILLALLNSDHLQRYDLNKVTYEELLYFQGIGTATAVSILDYQQNIGFNKVDDLLNIRGIGERRLAIFKEFFYVEGDTLINNIVTVSQIPVVEKDNIIITPSSDLKININTASLEELMTLRGIGQSRANGIIEYRTQHGRFRTLDDIKNVHGIGNQIFEQIKDNITVGN